jgi:CheY-like chemotaxis protein
MTILVVEDDHAVREALEAILREEGHAVLAAGDGAEGLRQLRAHDGPVHLILLDLMMPVMDGRQFRAEMRRDPRLAAIPVVILTAHRDRPARDPSLGAAAYLKKPLDLETLLNVVNQHGS